MNFKSIDILISRNLFLSKMILLKNLKVTENNNLLALIKFFEILLHKLENYKYKLVILIDLNNIC